MKIVSACLAGIRCKYDGTDNACPKVVKMVKSAKAIPVCPEQLGGLPTPRMNSEIKGGRVVNAEGEDLTEKFERGAKEVLKIARLCGAKEAILKQRSPSCGCGQVYDGSFSKKIVPGDGITAKLLKKNGISVKSEEDL